jgi:hypothetical protein
MIRSKVFESGKFKVRVTFMVDGVMLTTPSSSPSYQDDGFNGKTIPLDVWREINAWIDEQSEKSSAVFESHRYGIR